MTRREALLQQKIIHGLDQSISDEEDKKLQAGLPVQKIIGFINYDDLRINIDKNVLIPRYETQEVVEFALQLIKKHWRVLDLGTGSGYIGLTIKDKTNADVVMSDISAEALVQAHENALLNGLDVEIIKSNYFENIVGKFDSIISNPPYIKNGTILSDDVLLHEPHQALFGGQDGNLFYRKIVEQAPLFIKTGGFLILEISEDNVDFLLSRGFKISNDISNKPRIAHKQF